ncbi:MAG: GTP-binding protein, partial [Gammaproteobacteria bacterium]
MQATPKGLRLHIGIFGRRNAGKSSLLNAITRQQVAIVSDIAGTTTDPVEKPMELLPLGPVLFIDTAGVDDTGELGELRIKKTEKAFERTDLGVIVTAAGWSDFEQGILEQLQKRDTPVIVVFNKADLQDPDQSVIEKLQQDKITVVKTSAINGGGVLELRKALLDSAPADYINNPAIVGDLVP